MASFLAFPSPSSVFSAYASLSASIMLLKSMINQFIPRSIQGYLCSIFQKYFKPRNPSSDFSLIVQEKDGMSINEVYTDAELYLNTIINPETDSLKITKRPTETNFSLKFSKSENVVDSYNGIELKWNFVSKKSSKSGSESDDDEGSFSNEKRSFVLSFDKKHKKMILSSYVPFIHKKVQEIKSQKKILNLHTLAYHSGIIWGSVSLQHPSTFDTLAIDSAMKKAIIDDLDRFVKRKEFYKKVGKAWKRGYLLYGPPGTGKSSLVAAMANYLKFDIYDMELTNVRNNSDLRKLLLRTDNRSILVIEDIDCSIKIPNRADPDSVRQKRRPIDQTFTLSGLLNFIDGLWSSCGVERIIIFTTNNKEKLDPALLRPGRMDMHIHMSYLTADGFRLFAKNYLNIQQHWRFEEIEELIKKMNVTPAEVAEELMKSDDADISLEGLVHFLKNKKNTENDHKGKDVNNDEEIEQSKGEIGNNDDDDDENYVANDNGLLETDQSSDESFSE